MGLLDDLLGGLAGSPAGGRVAEAPTRARGAGGSMGQVLMALMPVVLAMMSNRGSRPRSPGSAGGLGDILGQVLGGATGGGGTAGGLGAVLAQLQRAGFGEQADSWVGSGANKPIPPGAMTQIFGRDGIEEMSRQAGLSEADTADGLSQLLREVVDRVTPAGNVPDLDSLTRSVADLPRQFGVR